jgi:hypothetical protein
MKRAALEGAAPSCDAPSWPEGVRFNHAIRLRQLIADRQPADAFAGRSKDGIAKRGRKRRHARLADAARRHIDAVLDDVRVGHGLKQEERA